MAFEQVGLEAVLKGAAKYITDAQRLERQNKALGRSAQTTAAVAGTSMSRFTASVGASLTAAGTSVQNFGRTISAAGPQLAILGAALAAPGIIGIKMAADLETSFTKIETLVGIARKDVAGFRDDVLDLSGETAKAPKELADALFVVTSAGARGAQAMEILTLAAKAGAAGLGETASIARVVTASLQAWSDGSLDATRATDILLATVREGNLEASELAGSLGRVLGVASSLGLEFSEVGAFIATFTRLGVDSAEAVTALRGTMNSLIKGSEESREVLAEVGLELSDLQRIAREEGLAKALFTIIAASEGNIEKLAALIPNIRALSGILGTAGVQAEEFDRINRSVADSLGLTEAAFERTAEDAAFQFSKAVNDLKIGLIELGVVALPIVVKGLDEVSGSIEAFQNLSPRMQKLILGVSAFGVALVALGATLAIVGAAITGIGIALSALGAVFTGASLAMTIMLGPVGLIILALAALVVGVILVIKHWDEISAAAKKTGKAISKAWGEVEDALIGVGKAVLSWFKQNWPLLLSLLAGPFAPIVAVIIHFREEIAEIFLGLVRDAFNWGKGILSQMWVGILAAKSSFLGLIDSFVDSMVAKLDPFNWVFGSTLPEVMEDFGQESGEAFVMAMEESLGNLGAVIDREIAGTVRQARDLIADMHSELMRLLGLPTVEGAAAGLELARLRLEEFGISPQAEAARRTREAEIEQLEKLIDTHGEEQEALEDSIDAREAEKEALEEEFKSLTGASAERRNEIQQRIAQIDRQNMVAAIQIKMLEDEREAIEEKIEATEKERISIELELEAVQKQIRRLEQLAEKRQLEADMMVARGLVADQTLLTDAELVQAADLMIQRIGAVTEEIGIQVGDIHSQWIPALIDVADQMGATGGKTDELGGAVRDLGDVFGDDIGEGSGLIGKMKVWMAVAGITMIRAEALRDWIFELVHWYGELRDAHAETAREMAETPIPAPGPPVSATPPSPFATPPNPNSQQHGGFTPAGRTQLALLHGPEVTIPLRASLDPRVASMLMGLAGMAGGRGGGFRNYGTVTIAGDNDIGRSTGEAIMEALQ